MYTLLLCNEKGHRVHLRKNERLFRSRVYLVGNILCCVRARAHLRALMTQKLSYLVFKDVRAKFF